MTAGNANDRLEGAFLQLIEEKPYAKIITEILFIIIIRVFLPCSAKYAVRWLPACL